jgi:hypothetical protein
MSSQQDIPLFPVCGWELAPVKEMGAIILRLDYLATPTDTPDSPNQGLRHVMGPDQARELAAALIRQADYVQSGGSL